MRPPDEGLDRSLSRGDQPWTHPGPEQKHAFTIARDWARQHLLPWATAGNFAAWYATSTVGRILFGGDDLEDAFEWWSAEQRDLTHPNE